MRIYLIVAAFVCASMQALGSGNFYYDHYSTSQGLSHKTVTDILRTSDGFLWIGTTNGLNRFDGYSIKVYDLNDAGQLGSGSNIIHGLAESSVGQLFVATNNGVKYYDNDLNRFEPISIDNSSGGQISAVCPADSGAMWISRAGIGLYRIIPEGSGFRTVYQPIPAEFKSKGLFDVWQIYYRDSVLWMASSFGLLKFDIRTGTFNEINVGKVLPYCSSVKAGIGNEIIFTSSLEGILIINTETLKIRWVKFTDLTKIKKGIGHLLDVAVSPAGELFIAASPGVFRQQSPSDPVLDETPFLPELLQIDVSNTMYLDNEGTLWIGTLNYGFFGIKNNARSFKPLPIFDSKNLSHTLITSMQVLDNGNILYGNTQGLYNYTPKTNGNRTVAKITDKPIASIQVSSLGEIYYFTHDSLVQYYPKTGKMQNIASVPNVFTAYIQDSIIWYSRWSFGLRGYHLRTGKRYSIIIDSAELSLNTVFCITGDKDDKSLWLGTYGTGMVHVVDPKSESPILTRFTKSQAGNSISQNEILTIHDNGNGSLWISTSGSGINRFDKATQHFESITTRDGLHSNVTESINSDANGDIWLASSVLTKYNTQSHIMTHYTSADGVIDEFNVGVTHRAADGHLYFGGNGIVQFHPDSILPGMLPVCPLLTGLYVFGQEVQVGDSVQGCVILKHNLTGIDSLRLPYWAHHFTLNFASLQLRYSNNISYAYMLEGFDQEWIPASSANRNASYSGLEPGEYTFLVKAANDRGVWSEVRRLHIEIFPAWWNTLLFKLTLSIALSLLVVWYVYQRMKQVRVRTTKLELTIAQRTKELKKANESLLNQADALNVQNESLRENQLFIELKNNELIETLQLKDKLIGIIGHDFKNSFTSLQNSAVLLNSPDILAKPDKTKTYASIILSTAQSILQQMQMVFDWATGQMDHLNYDPIEINAEILADDALSLVRASAGEKQIELSAQYQFSTNLYVDPRMISTVLRNLLTNAIKFTPIGGKVHVMVHERDSEIDIAIIDTGIGMDASKKAVAFSKLDDQHIALGTVGEKGSGLGLMICKNFIEKNNGTISVESNEGEGSVFTISLPKGEQKAVRKKKMNVEPIVPIEDSGLSGHYVAVIIDDDPQVLETLQEVFSPNFTVVQSRNGQEGLYLARNMMPDIIISDINMSGVNGMEICKMFKSDPLTSHIPFILITGENLGDVENEAYLNGANDVVAKPFNPYLLSHKLRTLLRERDTYGQQIREQEQPASAFPLPDDFENKMISKVIALVQDRMSDPGFDINTVADHVSMSRTQLWRIFKATTGKSLGDYIKDMRMQRASEMLRTGRYRISEVAYEIGFSDPKYFAKCFQKEFGMSPSAYAEKHNKKT